MKVCTIMAEAWQLDIRNWANQIANDFRNREGIEGVMIGGSIARGQEWQHSDLELGILVEERNPEIPYFNVIQGRGVEVIQVVRPDLETQLKQIEDGNIIPITQWPIQLWLGKVISDPTGVLKEFKTVFDSGLFTTKVIEQKLGIQYQKVKKEMVQANEFLNNNCPAAALVRMRYAMNEAILALHWRHGELPRSQNRTDSRLLQLCKNHDEMSFYTLYRDMFALDDSDTVIKTVWPKIKGEILDITRSWISGAYDFFKYAVDSNFEWGQNAGILTVYRLYIPNIGSDDEKLLGKIDNEEWVKQNTEILEFLGLNQITKEAILSLLQKFSAACDLIFLRPI